MFILITSSLFKTVLVHLVIFCIVILSGCGIEPLHDRALKFIICILVKSLIVICSSDLKVLCH